MHSRILVDKDIPLFLFADLQVGRGKVRGVGAINRKLTGTDALRPWVPRPLALCCRNTGFVAAQLQDFLNLPLKQWQQSMQLEMQLQGTPETTGGLRTMTRGVQPSVHGAKFLNSFYVQKVSGPLPGKRPAASFVS